MNAEYILNSWESDSVYSSNLSNESLKIPQLHHKYIKMKYFNRETIIKVKETLEKLELKKSEYYRGVSRDDQECYDLKILKNELPMYLKADKDIQPLRTKLKELEEIDIILESIIQQINNRSFQIKSAIEYQKFMNGVN